MVRRTPDLEGRFDEAFAKAAALQLDPLSLIMKADLGVFYFSRQYDRAIAQLNGELEMEPVFPRAHMVISAYVRGRYAEALAKLDAWKRETGWGLGTSSWARAYIYGRAGQNEG